MATMASTCCDCCHGTFAERNLLIYIYIFIYIYIQYIFVHFCKNCINPTNVFFTITLHDAHVSYMYFQMGLPECG